MTRLERDIWIAAPPETVFALLDAPQRIPEFTPGVDHIGAVRRTDARIGDWVEVTYSVLGLPFPMKMHTVAYRRLEQVTLRMAGGMRGTFDWQLAAQAGGTHLRLTVDYEMAGGILGRAVNVLLIERMNEKNGEQLLENIKLVAETEGIRALAAAGAAAR